MVKISEYTSLSYKDINLLAQLGKVKSRSEIKNEGHRIVVSAMTSIIGPTFIQACANLPDDLKPTLHIPRDIHFKENLQLLHDLKYPITHVFVGLGLNTLDYEEFAYKLGFETVLLDIANGYLPQVSKKVYDLSKRFKVIAGSIHTYEGYEYLVNSGCNIVRSGIAPGSVCITKDSTGFTRGTITEILALADSQEEYQLKYNSKKKALILADGGIKSPSDINKAFLCGADYIMSGRLFVQAIECRMHNKDEVFAKYPISTYFGMASNYGKKAMGHTVCDHIEGTSEYIAGPYIALETIIKTLWEGIRSGISYSGYASVSEAIGNGYIEVIK